MSFKHEAHEFNFFRATLKSHATYFSFLVVFHNSRNRCWQSKRYFEKVDMIAKRVEELNMPMKNLESNAQCFPEEQVAIPVQPLIPSGNNNVDNAPTLPVKREEFRSTSIEGKFRHDDELLMGPRGPPLGRLNLPLFHFIVEVIVLTKEYFYFNK